MRVLHLPFNIASQADVTVRALRDLGVDARGLAKAGVVASSEHIETYPAQSSRRAPLAFLQRYWKLLTLIAWADVLHWHFGVALYGALDLRFARLLRKRMCVEYWGSDIRIAEIEAADNPAYAALPRDERAWAVATPQRSRRLQRMFARAGAKVVVGCASLDPHLLPDCAPRGQFRTRQRVYIPDYTPRLPNPDNSCPLVLHSPTSRALKGTAHVLAAVEHLRARDVSFEYRQIENMPHAEALELLAQCDVYVDQFIGGHHGLAALEAMALGKPVVCYIKPTLVPRYPPELPIVIANTASLPDVLAELLADGPRRRRLGAAGRAYVERYHDAHKLAAELIELYKSL